MGTVERRAEDGISVSGKETWSFLLGMLVALKREDLLVFDLFDSCPLTGLLAACKDYSVAERFGCDQDEPLHQAIMTKLAKGHVAERARVLRDELRLTDYRNVNEFVDKAQAVVDELQAMMKSIHNHKG